MFGWDPAVVGTFLVLICNRNVWAAEECQPEPGEKPIVKPHSATELEISWEGVFKNCSDDHTVIVRFLLGGDVSNPENFEGNLTQNNSIVTKDPCLQYTINVKVKGNIGSFSSPNNYNSPTEQSDDMFGGYLKQELSKFRPEKPLVLALERAPFGSNFCE